MRWEYEDEQKILEEKCNSGETKIIEKFLWLPQELNGEFRWLENVKIRCKVGSFSTDMFGLLHRYV